MAITAKKKAFAQAVFDGATNKEAAIFAGYSPETASAAGSRLAKDAGVLAHLESLKNVKAAPVIVKAEKPKTEKPPVNMDTINSAGDLDDPLEFLKSVWTDGMEEMKFRIAAARAALPYKHGRVADKGKKETREEAAREQSSGNNKFATRSGQLPS